MCQLGIGINRIIVELDFLVSAFLGPDLLMLEIYLTISFDIYIMRKYKSFWVVLIYFSYISYPKIIATHIQYKGRTEKNYNNNIYHTTVKTIGCYSVEKRTLQSICLCNSTILQKQDLISIISVSLQKVLTFEILDWVNLGGFKDFVF